MKTIKTTVIEHCLDTYRGGVPPFETHLRKLVLSKADYLRRVVVILWKLHTIVNSLKIVEDEERFFNFSEAIILIIVTVLF